MKAFQTPFGEVAPIKNERRNGIGGQFQTPFGEVAPRTGRYGSACALSFKPLSGKLHKVRWEEDYVEDYVSNPFRGSCTQPNGNGNPDALRFKPLSGKLHAVPRNRSNARALCAVSVDLKNFIDFRFVAMLFFCPPPLKTPCFQCLMYFCRTPAFFAQS